jgi:alpha-ketoglutaric semialdehyde dehydrogenase
MVHRLRRDRRTGDAYNCGCMPITTQSASSFALSGCHFIGYREVPGNVATEVLRAVNPATGEVLPGKFLAPDSQQINTACLVAADAAQSFGETTREARALFLEAIAEELLDLGAALVERAHRESGLPMARLEGERGRTIGQLRLFAGVLRTGAYLDITVDTPLPERKPLPRPSLRTMRIPLGPVAVFGASNFPLAFSVAGGDTVSALAAGCPVVVRAHPAHPGTSELAARAILSAAKRTAMPEGVFSLLNGPGNRIGEAIVTHPAIQAVGFTGSRKGGLALTALAQARPTPIPVFAEMSSINPVFILPGVLAQRSTELGRSLAASVLLGVGQFCTNPGVVFGIASKYWELFRQETAAAMASAKATTMLHSGIARAYEEEALRLTAIEGVEILARGEAGGMETGEALLCGTTAATFLLEPGLAQEVFGPCTVLVTCDSFNQMLQVATQLEGQLTCTIHFAEEGENADPGVQADQVADASMVRTLLPILQTKAGRLVANGFPTGVDVGTAMVHGGPFPATTDSRQTSVGSMAIGRWLRPVCFQDFPDSLLPDALHSEHLGSTPCVIDGLPSRVR